MSDKKKLLVQLDPDPQPSLFDRIVAYDAGADEVLSHGGVRPEHIRELVHGCIFTRGPKDLVHTAIFVGGKDAGAGEILMAAAERLLLPKFGLTVSMMLDANGANTTAAACVRCVSRHLKLRDCSVGVLGAGPVGARVALMLAIQGAKVLLVDVQASRAESVRQRIRDRLTDAAVHTATEASAIELAELQALVAAGPTGKQVLSQNEWLSASGLCVLIDLNAVPPLGLEGVQVTDDGQKRESRTCYGALGVGKVKMQVHKAAIAQLFTRNDLLLDAETILPLALALP